MARQPGYSDSFTAALRDDEAEDRDQSFEPADRNTLATSEYTQYLSHEKAEALESDPFVTAGSAWDIVDPLWSSTPVPSQYNTIPGHGPVSNPQLQAEILGNDTGLVNFGFLADTSAHLGPRSGIPPMSPSDSRFFPVTGHPATLIAQQAALPVVTSTPGALQSRYPEDKSRIAPFPESLSLPPPGQSSVNDIGFMETTIWGDHDPTTAIANLVWYLGYFGNHPYVLTQAETAFLDGGKNHSKVSHYVKRHLHELLGGEEARLYKGEHDNKGSSKGRVGTLRAPDWWSPPTRLQGPMSAVQIKAAVHIFLKHSHKDVPRPRLLYYLPNEDMVPLLTQKNWEEVRRSVKKRRAEQNDGPTPKSRRRSGLQASPSSTFDLSGAVRNAVSQLPFAAQTPLQSPAGFPQQSAQLTAGLPAPRSGSSLLSRRGRRRPRPLEFLGAGAAGTDSRYRRDILPQQQTRSNRGLLDGPRRKPSGALQTSFGPPHPSAGQSAAPSGVMRPGLPEAPRGDISWFPMSSTSEPVDFSGSHWNDLFAVEQADDTEPEGGPGQWLDANRHSIFDGFDLPYEGGVNASTGAGLDAFQPGYVTSRDTPERRSNQLSLNPTPLPNLQSTRTPQRMSFGRGIATFQPPPSNERRMAISRTPLDQQHMTGYRNLPPRPSRAVGSHSSFSPIFDCVPPETYRSRLPTSPIAAAPLPLLEAAQQQLQRDHPSTEAIRQPAAHSLPPSNPPLQPESQPEPLPDLQAPPHTPTTPAVQQEPQLSPGLDFFSDEQAEVDSWVYEIDQLPGPR